MTVETQPAAFLGHGSPMNAIEHNRYTDAWRALGASVYRPRAVLAVSAHWFIQSTVVTAMARPRTIHDFYGFPDALFAVDYPAPGSPELAEEVADIAKPTWVGLDHDGWGLDHGTWSVLCHVFPDADIPVVQLSISTLAAFDHHVELGARLAPLRQRGVLIVASGNVVHNLGRLDPRRPEDGFDWAHRFDEAAGSALTGAPASVAGLVDHPDYPAAVPTPEHFIPLLYLAGVAEASGEPVETLARGYALGSLSMSAYAVGAAASAPSGGGPAGELPDPSEVPPEDT